MIYVHFSGQSGGSTGLKNEHKSLTKLTFCLNKKLNFVNDFLKNSAVLQILIPEYLCHRDMETTFPDKI